MSIDFILPDIGEGIVECELLEWLVAEGQEIKEDQPVAEVMTDKATVQIPAMYSGVVKKLYYQPGDIAKVHAPLFAMDVEQHVTDTATAVSSPTSDMLPRADTEVKEVTGDSHASSTVEDFILPDIGEGIVECEIVKWYVNEGDEVAEDQVVVEVMTDKAVVEIPAKTTGKIATLYYQQGDIAKVHSPLFALQVEGVAAELPDAAQHTPSTLTKAVAVKSEQQWQDGAYDPPIAISGKVLASPAVRRLARERAIDLQQVQGSGKKGRILKADLDTATQPMSTTVPSAAPAQQPVTTANGGVRVEKMRGVRAAMAKQMLASVQTIPHFTVSDELPMDALMALRELLKPDFAAQGVKLSFMPFFVKALSLALNEFPIINAQLNEDMTELSYFADHNIGFAVDSPLGLLVPNIKRVQSLSLFEIAQQMQQLIEKAREGKLPSDALKGGTISISNVGTLGGMNATPIINKPEAAIVALGKTQKLPRFDSNGAVVAQHIMPVSWSGDHRIIDGATMVRFNNLWCSYLTEPMRMLTHLR